MNTKQVEELTPCREQQNSYRDYSKEDVERLKLIKMLRMFDMPLKEIEKIIKNEISIQEAAGIRQKELSEQQKQIQQLPDSVPVYGKIYNSSQTAKNHVLIKGELVDEIGNSPYVDRTEKTLELI